MHCNSNRSATTTSKKRRKWSPTTKITTGDVLRCGDSNSNGGGSGEIIVHNHIEYHQNTQINLINIQNYNNYLREFQLNRNETHI